LSSIDLLQVKKLKEHVYQKILKLDENNQQNDTNNNLNSNNQNSINSHASNSNSTINQHSHSGNSNNSNEINSSNSTDISLLANRTIELICSDQVSSNNVVVISDFIC
jgi:hypothetical protein